MWNLFKKVLNTVVILGTIILLFRKRRSPDPPSVERDLVEAIARLSQANSYQQSREVDLGHYIAIASLAISIVSAGAVVILTRHANQTANDANRIALEANSYARSQADSASRQASILEASNAPFIEIVTEGNDLGPSGDYQPEHVMVVNRGAAIRDLDVDEIAFLKIDYRNDTGIHDQVLIPLSGYDYYRFETYEGQGVVYELNEAREDYTLFQPIQADFYNNFRHDGIGFIGVDRYFRVSYTDLTETWHTEYFTPHWYGGPAISLPDSEGEQLFSYHDQLLKQGTSIQLSQITPSSALALWEQLAAATP